MNEPEKKRGFAALTPERRHEIAVMGGKSVPERKRTFYRKRKLARKAGRKGGLNVPDEKRSFYLDRTHAAEAGRKGGKAVLASLRPFSQDNALACRAGRKGGRAKRTRPDTSAGPN